MAIGSVRWGGLRAEPYNPNPKDADLDQIVQEGTAFERPAGSRYVNAAGEEITDLFTGTNISQLDGLRLVDADGNDVSYVQTWRRESLSVGDRLGTIGDSMGTISTSLGTIDKPPTVEEYRGLHTAPTRDTGAALHDLTLIYPEDVYSPMGMRFYGSGDPADARRERELFSILSAARGNPDAEIVMYRAVPEEGVDTINPGDWVTPSRSYAVEHGEGPMRGRYRIIEQTVRAGDLYTDGNYIYEFGYDPTPSTQPVEIANPSSGKRNVPKGKELRAEDKGVMFSALNESGTGTQVNKVVNPDGTLSIEGMNADGTFIEYDPSTEAKLDARYDELGVTRDQLTLNLAHSAMLAMGYDPTTGTFDEAKLEEGLRVSKWYSTQSDRLRALADDRDVEIERVVAAATVMSAGRLWDGPANGNYESTERLIDILQADEPIEITQAMAAFMRWRSRRGSKSTSALGFHTDIKANQSIRPSELDSAQLVEVLYAANALRGYKTFSSWRADSEDGTKAPARHANTPPVYPLFTSKGTLQVKQAVAVLRGDVTVRESISGPKYSSFYSNLLRPDVDYSSTNDTWHYRVMAGNSILNPLTSKGKLGPGTMRELTTKDNAKYGYWRVNNKTGVREWVPYTVTAQDLFQSGLERKKDGLASGDLMFRDSTKITKGALAALKLAHPDVFGDMKLHEIQALVWVHFGGGTLGADEGLEIWEDALRKMPIDGSWIDLVK